MSNSAHTDEDTAYAYDAAGQLTGATATNEAYTYDANGNRVAVTSGSADSTYVTGANNKIVDDGTYNYHYDANGTTIRRTDDSTGAYTTYTWDFRNRLTAVTDFASDGTKTQEVDYTYDVDNELVGRQVLDGSGAAVSAQRFVYDGQQIVLAFDGAGNLTDRMLWGPAVDQLLAQESVTNLSSVGAVDWALADNQNTIRDWVDDSWSSAGHAAYTAFSGQQTSATGYAASADVIFGCTGKFEDPLTGLQYNLSWWYDPATGRWISEDPSGFEGADPDLSRYAMNASTNLLDPSGLAPEGSWPALATKEPRTYSVIANGQTKSVHFDSNPETIAPGVLGAVTTFLSTLKWDLSTYCDDNDRYHVKINNKSMEEKFEVADKVDGIDIPPTRAAAGGAPRKNTLFGYHANHQPH